MNLAEAKKESQANEYSGLAPRFWHGMRAGIWWRLLARNRFRLSLSRCHIALGVTAISPINDMLATLQKIFYQRKIENSRIESDPIFILGHWRSGTTWLHELLVSNPEFASPNTYQCFAPSHFLISPWVAQYGSFLLPKKRPMDNMAAGWLLPQEDEFALMNLGVPTPYLRIAFPRTQHQNLEYLDFVGLDQDSMTYWKQRFLWFLKALTLNYEGKRLVLKSPPHTGRLRLLIEMFPKARFIHLVRNPRQLFPSTMRLWRSLDQVQSLQVGQSENQLKQFVIDCMQRMYAGFDAGRIQVPDHQIVEVRYEDLVAQPEATLERIYADLNLGDFARVRGFLKPMLEQHASYQTNQHRDNPRWSQDQLGYFHEYARRFGYD